MSRFPHQSRLYTDLNFSPILYRTFYLLTPPSELPPLPQTLHKPNETPDITDTPLRNPSYLPIHLYTILQIVITVIIFILTLTRGAPAFPVLIIALVPFRLLLMKRWWPREVLRFVDAWACREGTPEDDEDAAKAQYQDTTDSEQIPVGILAADARIPAVQSSSVSKEPAESHSDLADQRIWGTSNEDMNNEWVELQERRDEELGRDFR